MLPSGVHTNKEPDAALILKARWRVSQQGSSWGEKGRVTWPPRNSRAKVAAKWAAKLTKVYLLTTEPQEINFFSVAGRFRFIQVPYFSIDNAHLMYNAHPNFFDIPFDV